MDINRKPKKNIAFQILTGIAILLVVCGHLDLQTFSLFGLFPYYSFHVMTFVFISGYFYKDECEEQIVGYILKKAKHLLLPYFLWNLFYGILVTILHRLGFGFGENLSFKSFFVQPFLDGHQYMLNFASWFVPALFMLQLMNLFGRKILACIRLKNEWIILFGTLLLGMATVYLAIKGHVWGNWKMPGRLLFMLPVYEMGIFYRKKLEKYAEKVPDYIMIALVAVIQLLLKYTCASLVYTVVWCSNFNNGPIIPYITTITGIVFWYRIAKLLGKGVGENDTNSMSKPIQFLRKVQKWVGGLLASVGDMSFSIMMHHILAFFLIKCLSYYLYLHHVGSGFELFDLHMFRYDVDYVYWIYDLPATKWLYLLIGLTFSALLYKVERAVIRKASSYGH